MLKQDKKSNQTLPFKPKAYEFNHFEKKINLNNFQMDRRMRFRISKDPIYIAFDFIDKQPLDKLAKEWDTIRLINVSESELASINDKVRKANELIKKHDLNSLIEANKIMERLIKDNK